MTQKAAFDFVVIGSGFGGSVSALRLAEKNHSVLVLEQGRRFKASDFPRTNWNIKRWMWWPLFNCFGPFKMSFFSKITIYSGVGVGGGSLIYGNTLPVPKDSFFKAASWAHLADWKQQLAPFYDEAKRMLGVAKNPYFTLTDRVMEDIARENNCLDSFQATDVAVFFGEAGKTVADPYFAGAGPQRTGCIYCGACMTGCRYGAKNTLDKNYLYFAEKRGATIQADSQVLAIRPRSEGGYELTVRRRKGWLRFAKETVHAQQVVISAGVLGSVELLLKMRQDPKALPHLSPRLGQFVRTNNESIIGVVTSKPQYNFSEGIAISSIIHTDEHSHIEPVRYGLGSGFFRLLLAPHAPGANFWMRSKSWMSSCATEPWRWLQAIFVSDFSKSTQILLYMRSLDGTLTFTLKKRPYLAFRQTLGSILGVEAKQPQAFMKEATDLAKQFAKRVDGVLANVFTESLLGIASTAHILGGCCMGQNPEEGVIDHQHQVFGYKGLYVIDGSAVSANPGVNPSLTITALAERAMSFIKPAAQNTKSAAQDKV